MKRWIVGLAVVVALATQAQGGVIVGWGRNDFGQATVPTGNDFIAIAAGGYHSLALKSDGSLVGWGYRGGATVPTGNDFIAIAAGSYDSLALTLDGSLVGWGHNHYGHLPVPTGNDFTAIAVGDGHSLALKSDSSPVPEPSTLAMFLGLGGMGVIAAWRRRKRTV
jgi:alpha-tubulin suppressor-like RCC1 family protein